MKIRKIMAGIRINESSRMKTFLLMGIVVVHAAISIYIAVSLINNLPLLYRIYEPEQVYWIIFVDSVLALVNIVACIGLLIQSSFGFWFSTSYFSYKAMRSVYEAIVINRVFAKLTFSFSTLMNIGIPLLLFAISAGFVYHIYKNYHFGGKLTTAMKLNVSLVSGVMINTLCMVLGQILS